MPSIQETMQWIGSEAFQHTLGELYGDQPGETRLQADRYQALVRQYEQSYGDGDVYLFSSPGRTEISGNHTDHNLGKVIAASINMDCVGAAAKNEDNKVRIHSVTYNEQFVIDLNAQEDPANPSGTYTRAGYPGRVQTVWLFHRRSRHLLDQQCDQRGGRQLFRIV